MKSSNVYSRTPRCSGARKKQSPESLVPNHPLCEPVSVPWPSKPTCNETHETVKTEIDSSLMINFVLLLRYAKRIYDQPRFINAEYPDPRNYRCVLHVPQDATGLPRCHDKKKKKLKLRGRSSGGAQAGVGNHPTRSAEEPPVGQLAGRGSGSRETAPLPSRLQELLQAPLGGQVLHHDCTSMIVSRLTTFTENFVICWNQITKMSARGTAPPMRLLHGAIVILVLLIDLAISVFGKVSFNTVFTQIHTSRRRRLQRWLMRRTSV